MNSKEGYQWTPATGLQKGLPSKGATIPSDRSSTSSHYDVIVIGAGFAGLVAVRDLALRGKWAALQSSEFSMAKCDIPKATKSFC